MASSAKRIDWIDIAKGIGMLFVLAGHVIDFDAPLSRYIYSFHMPLFFLLAGMVCRHEKYAGRGSFIKKEWKACIRPYLLAAGVSTALCIAAGVCRIPGDSTLIWSSLWYGVPYAFCNEALWFLPALFFVKLYDLILFRIFRKQRIQPVLSVAFTLLFLPVAGLIRQFWADTLLAAIPPEQPQLEFLKYLPFRTDVAFYCVPFFAVGVFAQKYTPGLKKLSLLKKMILLAACALLHGLACMRNARVIVSSLAFGNPVLFYAGAFAFSVLVIVVSMLLENASFQVHIRKILLFIGRNSIVFLCTQLIVLRSFLWVVSTLTGTHYVLMEKTPIWLSLLLFAVGLVLCALISEILAKIE